MAIDAKPRLPPDPLAGERWDEGARFDRASSTVPLVLHIVYRFDTGGLENGVANLINHLPPGEFRHAVVALTEVTSFRDRVLAPGVEFFPLHKGPGHALRLYPRLYALMRRLRPAIVHTRNLAALEAVVPAWAAGVPVRIHGEHGRDVIDLDGSNRRLQRVRRLYRPFVSHYVALSADLADDLVQRIGVAAPRVSRLCNGVDTDRFRPAAADDAMPAGFPFDPARHVIVGGVGRLQEVKNPLALIEAFAQVVERQPAWRDRLRLVLVGDGALRAACEAALAATGLRDIAWLAGERSDIAALMRTLRVFVLPSLAEGISNTVLEAMASGLPVVAAAVGGNAELVHDGVTGLLVPKPDPALLADAIGRLVAAPDTAAAFGRAGRLRAEQQFSLHAMVERYRTLYTRRLQAA
jgi:sugar transferase (PEP-CTERM/EpsH1 system associated)